MGSVATGPRWAIVRLIREGKEPAEHGHTDEQVVAVLAGAPTEQARALAVKLIAKRCALYRRIHGAVYLPPEPLRVLAFPEPAGTGCVYG